MAKTKWYKIPTAMLTALLEMEERHWENRRRPLMRRAIFVTDGRRKEMITDKVWRLAFPRRRSQFGRTARLF